MDEFLKKQMALNTLNYKSSLEQIIEKYSKLQYQDGGMEVDLNKTNAQTLERYMRRSKTKLKKLESKSLADLREDSIRGMFTDDTTVSSLDESQRYISETESQPEDQDEELEMSLSSRNSSLVKLYPSMISRIGRAWHRQQVSEAADSVLRRYRRWRQQSNRSSLNHSFTVTLRPGYRNPQNMTCQTLLEGKNTNSPMKRQFTGTEATPRSPLQMVTRMQDWQVQQPSSKRVRREQHQPVLVMDFSGPSMPKESSLNKTFTVSEESQLEEQPSTYKFSPSRPCYPTAKASMDSSLRSKRLSLAAHSLQTDGCCMHASEATAVEERPDIYGSPVRQRPVQAKMMTILSRSPQELYRSPKAHSVESFSREPMRARLMSTPPQKPAGTPAMLYPHDSYHFPRSPQSAKAEGGRHRLRQDISLDFSLPSIPVTVSLKKLDEDFLKLYHKFVCQNKSPLFKGAPCRLCARNSDTSRGPSSSALAALALSPHCSLLRKRHRELDWDSHPQSKRYRAQDCPSSPGSKRHGKEMLRRRLSLAEYEQSHEDHGNSSTKPSFFQRFRTQQRSADAHQETWMSRRRLMSDFSGMGSLFESRTSNGFSPRK